MEIDEQTRKREAFQYGIAQLERVVLTSAPLERTYEEIRLPIFLREPGCWLSAPFGEGKTVAINFCARALAEEIPGLPVFIVNEHVLPGGELRSFLISALIASKYFNPHATKTESLRIRLSHYWAELSEESPLKCVVLFLDEGSAIRQEDESMLKDLSNEIFMQHGSLQTIVFGEKPGLDVLVSNRRNNLKSGATDRLWGGHKLELHLYQSKSDWVSLFEKMDTNIFKELENRTIRNFFFGHLRLDDYAMKNEAERFWAALEWVKAKKRGIVNLRRIFVGIRRAILNSAISSLDANVQDFEGISTQCWKEALEYGCLSGD